MVDLTKIKPSENFIDRTGDDYRNSLDWVWLLGRQALANQKIDPSEGLRGLTPEQVNEILFNKAMEEFSVSTMQDYSKWPYQNPLFPTIGPTYPRLKKKRKNVN